MALIETIGNLVKQTKDTILKIGTPPEKEVLYQEVIKRKVPKESAEQLLMNDVKTLLHIKPKNTNTSKMQKDVDQKPIVKPKTKKKAAVKKATTTSKKTTPKQTDPKKKATVTKKEVTKKETSKKPLAKKTPSAPRGAKKAAKIALYIKDIKKHYGEVDEAFVAIIVKNLGPSIYKKDAELVSCSDPKELNTVRKNFLIKKLGIEASQGVLDAAIADVCDELKATRTKYRATFYYALAKKFKKESVLN